jgi:hypothetical protein
MRVSGAQFGQSRIGGHFIFCLLAGPGMASAENNKAAIAVMSRRLIISIDHPTVTISPEKKEATPSP